MPPTLQIAIEARDKEVKEKFSFASGFGHRGSSIKRRSLVATLHTTRLQRYAHTWEPKFLSHSTAVNATPGNLKSNGFGELDLSSLKCFQRIEARENQSFLIRGLAANKKQQRFVPLHNTQHGGTSSRIISC